MTLSRELGSTEPGSSRSQTFAGVRWGLFARSLLPWLLLTGVVAVLTRIAAAPLTNDDTYFHLRFGQEFLHHWSLQHPGSVSTFATAHWVPTQWLPEVVMAKTDDLFGLAGVAWLSGLQQIGLAVSLYLLLRRWAEPLVVTLVMIPTFVVMAHEISMRPQVLSFILVLVTTTAWLRTSEDGRLRWWLVPVTWLWAMLHGMWPVGIAIGAIAILGLALDRRLDRRHASRALLIPVFSTAAAGLTPVGPALYGGIVAVQQRSSFFSEWNSPDFRSFTVLVLGCLIAVTAVAMLRSDGPPSWTELLLLVASCGCAVESNRTVPVAAMIISPLAARAIQPFFGSESPPVTRAERGITCGLGAAALAVLAITVPHTVPDPPPEPAWVGATMSSLPPGTKVANAWEWGGYLMWRYPQLDLLMHGYGDTFTVPELQRNTDIEALNPGWDSELRATGCRIAFLRTSSRLAYALQHQEHWTVVHRSSSVELLTAPTSW